MKKKKKKNKKKKKKKGGLRKDKVVWLQNCRSWLHKTDF